MELHEILGNSSSHPELGITELEAMLDLEEENDDGSWQIYYETASGSDGGKKSSETYTSGRKGAVLEKLHDVGPMAECIGKQLSKIGEGIASMGPDEVELSVGISLEGKKTLLFVAEGSARAELAVKAKWKKDA